MLNGPTAAVAAAAADPASITTVNIIIIIIIIIIRSEISSNHCQHNPKTTADNAPLPPPLLLEKCLTPIILNTFYYLVVLSRANDGNPSAPLSLPLCVFRQETGIYAYMPSCRMHICSLFRPGKKKTFEKIIQFNCASRCTSVSFVSRGNRSSILSVLRGDSIYQQTSS